MRLSEERMKEIADLKERLIQKIDGHHEEIALLEKVLAVIDDEVKGSSFTKASQMPRPDPAAPVEEDEEEPAGDDGPEGRIPIRQGGNGRILANAHLEPGQLSIVLEEGITLNEETPPFKSFFLGKILGGMRAKDEADADGGSLPREMIIGHAISKDGEEMRGITITNYRHKERADELIKTAAWSFERMLEHSQ